MAAANAIGRSGRVSPRKCPIVTDSPCTRNEAMPTPDKNHPPAMTQGVRHRHELRLVAELGEEHDPEADAVWRQAFETFRHVARRPK